MRVERRKYLTKKRSAIKIQTFMKVKWLVDFMSLMKKTAITIQRAAKRYIIKRRIYREILKDYMMKEEIDLYELNEFHKKNLQNYNGFLKGVSL